MDLNKKDWARLQWSIALFIALATTGAIIVSISTKALSDATQVNQQAKQASIAAHGKAANADQEAQELREKIAVYQALEARGIIGQEHRLEWIERIRKIKQDRKLIDLTYELGPQKLIDTKVISPSVNGFDFMVSTMKLKMGLLHENDLLGFLADLRNGIQGYIRVRNCDITRVAPAATTVEHGPAAQLHAECELGWVTLRDKR